MRLRVTALLAQRLGTIAPSLKPASWLLNTCIPKWWVCPTGLQQSASWNWARVLSLITGVDRLDLDSQALAAFGATCVDNRAAPAGFHANQKPMGSCAADFGRLVSAFHDEILYVD